MKHFLGIMSKFRGQNVFCTVFDGRHEYYTRDAIAFQSPHHWQYCE